MECETYAPPLGYDIGEAGVAEMQKGFLSAFSRISFMSRKVIHSLRQYLLDQISPYISGSADHGFNRVNVGCSPARSPACLQAAMRAAMTLWCAHRLPSRDRDAGFVPCSDTHPPSPTPTLRLSFWCKLATFFGSAARYPRRVSGAGAIAVRQILGGSILS